MLVECGCCLNACLEESDTDNRAVMGPWAHGIGLNTGISMRISKKTTTLDT